MKPMATPDFLLGAWTYRSFLSNPDIDAAFNGLEFGRGNIRIDSTPLDVFSGLIYGDGWQLTLSGSTNYGNPVTVRFQGKGMVGGEEWIYDYEGYVVKPWPNGIAQVPAIVGTIVRVIPHSSGSGGTAPAGVVAQWIAVKQG
jgi:hypothetical protein